MSEYAVTQHMGLTHKDFFRLLPVAMGTRDYEAGAAFVQYKKDGKQVRIELGPEGERRIALLVIPVTSVTIRLSGFRDSERGAFLETFNRAYQRGGG